MSFDRLPRERVDDLLTRFDILSNRAQQANPLVINYDGLSFHLLRAVGASNARIAMPLRRGDAACPANARQLARATGGLNR
eukprot:8132709-Pyramimonas_sp.AAC.1